MQLKIASAHHKSDIQVIVNFESDFYLYFTLEKSAKEGRFEEYKPKLLRFPSFLRGIPPYPIYKLT